jgi:hypothetical protein
LEEAHEKFLRLREANQKSSGTPAIEVPSVPLLQKGDSVLFMFQTQRNNSLQVRKSTDMAHYKK